MNPSRGEGVVEGKKLEAKDTLRSSKEAWEGRNLELLKQYLAIKNVSPQFDSDWEKNGEMDRAVDLYVQHAKEQGQRINGFEIIVVREAGRTPLIVITAEGTAPGNTLIYGHLDKQPEGGQWREDTPPWQATVKDGKLYGRGGADDGYALPAALTSLRILDERGVSRPRCTIIIETCEESGSLDLPYHLGLEEVAKRIGTPDTVVCLDSEAGDYKGLWETTSLRGLVDGTLEVEVLNEGKHSGKVGGAVRTSSNIASDLISRIENVETGEVVPADFYVPIPKEREEQIQKAAPLLAEEVRKELEEAGATHLTTDDPKELIRRLTWKPTLEVIGADDIPATKDAGNVLRPKTTLRLSMRIPPTLDAATAAAKLKELLEANPPKGAKVTFTINGTPGNGMNVSEHSQTFKKNIADASETYFGGEAKAMGIGGSIPFMRMLQEKFPQAQFLITGVLGPGSNAHGPNEFLDLSYVEKLTAALAGVVSGPR